MFHHNVVYGDVGLTTVAYGQPRQYCSHNLVYGAIAWLQALAAGPGAFDNCGNFMNGGAASQPLVPDPWDD